MLQQILKVTSILNQRKDNCSTKLRDFNIKVLSVISDVSGNTVTISFERPGKGQRSLFSYPCFKPQPLSLNQVFSLLPMEGTP